MKIDEIQGVLDIRLASSTREVIITHSALKTDADGVGQIFLSRSNAIHLANLLMRSAMAIEKEKGKEATETFPWVRIHSNPYSSPKDKMHG